MHGVIWYFAQPIFEVKIKKISIFLSPLLLSHFQLCRREGSLIKHRSQCCTHGWYMIHALFFLPCWHVVVYQEVVTLLLKVPINQIFLITCVVRRPLAQGVILFNHCSQFFEDRGQNYDTGSMLLIMFESDWLQACR